MNSSIYKGRFRHRRMRPAEHRFSYRMFMMFLDLSELDQVFKGRWLWSARRRALAEARVAAVRTLVGVELERASSPRQRRIQRLDVDHDIVAAARTLKARNAVAIDSHSRASFVDRFLAERQILADLTHPNIARLLDGGALEDGSPLLLIHGWHGGAGGPARPRPR